MPITGIDHYSGRLRSSENMEAAIAFYRVVGFNVLHDAEWSAGQIDKISVNAGDQKMNIRPDKSSGVPPHVGWIWEGGIDNLVSKLQSINVKIVRHPTPIIGGRNHGTARGICVVVSDPERTPVAFISYDPADLAKYDGPTYDEGYRSAAAQGEAAIASFLLEQREKAQPKLTETGAFDQAD
jgi:hypothetical protein